jgi:murein DD-endopeptidase MepM/ murein hydrolase activator NlpD
MSLLRIAGFGCAGLLVWTAAASRIVDQARLPVSAVVQGAVVTQPFGCTNLALEPYDPSCLSRHVHTGIDLSARLGAAVHAAAAGIAHVGYDRMGAGLYVDVAFDGHTRVLYCHLLRVDVVEGEQVGPGQVIGELGASGLATGPHVHLEVDVDGRAVDPIAWLRANP